MKEIYWTKDQFGMKYKYTNIFPASWLYFPDFVKTQKDIENFLTNNGRGESVKLTYMVDGKVVKYYKLKKRDQSGVHLQEEGGRFLIFQTSDFIPVSDQIEVLKLHADHDIKTKADRIEDENKKLSFLIVQAEPEGKTALHAKIEEAMNDEAIKRLCTEHAQQHHDLPALVEF
ncbi:MAG: hypothetical protein GX126_17625 [Bacteroidales bacterium]|nr:hypothetical protein [Bacteroidales bacterium]